MAFLFDTGIFSAVSSASAVMAGAKLYFYDAGTTTLKDTFTSFALDPLAKNANPVVADANGRWPAIWMEETLYKVKFTSSDETVIVTRDNVGREITSGDVSFIQSGSGAVEGTVQGELRATVRPEQFGAAGDGATDDTAAIQAAIDSIASTGGTVFLRGKYRVASNLSVAAGVNLRGDYACPRGRPSLGSDAAPDYSAMGSSLRIAPTATVTINGSSGVSGLVVYRYGMSFPATTSSTAAAFAGTAFTVAGDDPSFDNCFIMGFSKAILSDGAGRVRINRCNFDNLNCVEVTDCDDRVYISECHAWPFATICSGQSWENLIREGTAFYLHDFLDWGSITNCFSYGYQIGFRIKDINSTTLILCGADNVFDSVALNVDSVGIQIEGACYDTKLIGCQAAAQYSAGVNVNLTAGYVVHIENHTSWGITSVSGGGHGILVSSGSANISGGAIRNSKYGVSVALSTSVVSVDDMAFQDISVSPVNASVVTSNIKVGPNNNFGNFTGAPVGSNVQAATIASASPLVLDQFNDEYLVSGTTNFSAINYGWKGRRIMIQFLDALTVSNGTGSTSAIRLAGSINLTTTAGMCLFLYHNGVQWFEEGRIA